MYADNIAPEASEAMLQQFFSFCGSIVSLELADSTYVRKGIAGRS